MFVTYLLSSLSMWDNFFNHRMKVCCWWSCFFLNYLQLKTLCIGYPVSNKSDFKSTNENVSFYLTKYASLVYMPYDLKWSLQKEHEKHRYRNHTLLSERYHVMLGGGIPSALQDSLAWPPAATRTFRSYSRTRGASEKDRKIIRKHIYNTHQ